MTMYHQGNRGLQDEFGSRALAEKLEDLAPMAFYDEDKDVTGRRKTGHYSFTSRSAQLDQTQDL